MQSFLFQFFSSSLIYNSLLFNTVLHSNFYILSGYTCAFWIKLLSAFINSFKPFFILFYSHLIWDSFISTPRFCKDLSTFVQILSSSLSFLHLLALLYPFFSPSSFLLIRFLLSITLYSLLSNFILPLLSISIQHFFWLPWRKVPVLLAPRHFSISKFSAITYLILNKHTSKISNRHTIRSTLLPTR